MPRQGQEKGTPARRAEFIEHLRSIGPGVFCVSWPWSQSRGRYISIHVDGEKVLAHRWVYEQVYGVTLPRTHKRGVGEQVVMHTCDNRACVRPSHLILGDQLSNMRDASAKGRLAEDRRRKLTDEDVEEVRRLYAEHHTQSAIARHFGVSRAAIHRIVNGITRRGNPSGVRRLSLDQADEIRALVGTGRSQASVAKEYAVSPGVVSNIVRGKTLVRHRS